MKITAIIPESDSYWNVLKDLSDEVKLDLISCLSQSLLRSKAENKKIDKVDEKETLLEREEVEKQEIEAEIGIGEGR